MAILDTSSANTYLADTMTNSKAAADLVTGPLNPSSYIDPLFANISVGELPNLDPLQAADDLVGDFAGTLPSVNIPLPLIPGFELVAEGIGGILGDIVKFVDITDDLNNVMQIVNSMATVVSYVDQGIKTITDGNLPEDIKTRVVGLIAQSLMANGGTAALSLYSQVSAIMLPFVSGQTESSLTLALKASRLFGMEAPISASDAYNIDINTFRDAYDEKMAELTTEFDALTANGGLLKTVNISGAGGGGGGGGQGPGATSGVVGVTADGIILTAANPPSLQIPVPPPDKQFEGVDGNWKFESETTNQFMTAGGRFVSSVEELECEMSAIIRPISEVIVHWSETFTNANLTGLELERLTGMGSNAYHYIIKRDGSVERGVPLDTVPKVSAAPKHNTYSIQICLVGGINVASEDDQVNGNLGAGSITRTQFNTLHQIFRVFYLQFPGGQALGHGEFDVTQLDPGFEVRDYVYNAFNKQSLYTDPLTESEKSPEEIIAGINSEIVLLSEKDTENSGLENF